MSAADFHPEDLQLIGALMAGEVRVVRHPDGSLGYVEATGSRQDVVDGHVFLSQFWQHPDAQASGPEKWQALAEVVSDRINGWWEAEAAQNPGIAHQTFMLMEKAYQEGDKQAGANLVEHVRQYGAPSPVERSILALPHEEQNLAVRRIAASAEAEGLSFQQKVAVLNQMAEKGASAELVPTHQSEAQAHEALRAFGRERMHGLTAQQTLAGLLRSQASGEGIGSRNAPFEPRLSQEQKNREFLKTVPRETLNAARRAGINPEAYLAKTLDSARTAGIHDELQARLIKKDVKLPPMPRQVFNESNDRRADIERAMAARGVQSAEQLVPERRHRVSNDRELAVRAAYAEHTGQSPKQFERDTYVPPDVAAEYEDVEVPGSESTDDSARGDIERAWTRNEGSP